MKFDMKTSLAVLAVFVAAYHMGKKAAGGSGAATGSTSDPVASPADWWSYAGSWAM